MSSMSQTKRISEKKKKKKSAEIKEESNDEEESKELNINLQSCKNIMN